MLSSVSRRLRGFADDAAGTVKIEFIVVFPLILGWILSSFVFFDAYKNFSRSSKATYAVADIISRRTSVDTGFILNLHDMMDAMVPWSDNNKELRVTSLIYVKVSGGDPNGLDEDGDGIQDCYDDDSDATCEYQVQWSEASGTTVTYSGSNLPQDVLDVLPDIAENDTIILTETRVPYRPLLDNLGLDGMAWENAQATRPRYIAAIALDNS